MEAPSPPLLWIDTSGIYNINLSKVTSNAKIHNSILEDFLLSINLMNVNRFEN